jgi:hypothetical protein
LKGARTLLRDFNAAAKHELEQKIAASQAAVQHLNSIRQDLDYTYARIRCGTVATAGCVIWLVEVLAGYSCSW